MSPDTTAIEIDWDALAAWIRERGIGRTLSDIRPLAGGTQNRVIGFMADDRKLVLRCPPRFPRPSSNRTMTRESTVLTTLAQTDVPHPTLIAACDDLSVLGMNFYLMEEVDGFNPGEEVSDRYLADPTLRHESGLAVARALARLGNVDPSGTPMSELQRPGSFLSRQVDQWKSQLDGYADEPAYEPGSLPDVDRVADWLRRNQPEDATPGILHGDFHLNNVLLSRDRPEVAAFVDWEMATVGDPLLDLGWLLICWPQDPAPVGSGGRLASAGDLATRRELVAAYASLSHRDVSHIDWYTAMAGFKLGIVLEGTWVRSLGGKAPADVGERLHRIAISLLDVASQIAAGRWSVTAH